MNNYGIENYAERMENMSVPKKLLFPKELLKR